MKALLLRRVVLVCCAVSCLLTWSLVWAASEQEETKTISVLQALESEGKLTVRALRAWDQLPDRFIALAFELRSLDIDLMRADARKVRELANKADGNEQLRPLTEDLQALAEYMAEFGPQKPDTGSAGQQSARVETELEQEAPLSVAEQEALAQKLFIRIGTLKDYNLEGMEKLYLQVIAQAPESRLVHESYWRLSNIYMQAFSPPKNKEAIPLLEKYLQRYPDSQALDKRFAQFATPGIPLVHKRLVYLYKQEKMWAKAADLYAQLIPNLDEANQNVLQHCIAYGQALENCHRREEAIAVYQGYLRNTEKYSETLQRAARSRLQALGVTAPESHDLAFDNLHEAVAAGNLKKTQRLVEQGADISKQWNKGYRDTPLQIAVSKGHSHIAAYLLNQGADPDFTAAQYVRPPLILAAENADFEMVTLLLQAGADIHARSANKSTALHFAVQIGGPSGPALVNFLLDQGADPNLQDNQGKTPLSLVAANTSNTWDLQIAESLIAHGANDDLQKFGWPELRIAAIQGDGQQVRALLKNDPEQLRQDGEQWVWSILHAASRAGHADIVQLLIESGADINAKSANRKTPGYFAAMAGHRDVVELFKAQGADLQQLYFYLGSVISGKPADKELVAKLVAAGVDLHSIAGPQSRQPAVFLARDLDMLEYLIGLGADVNQSVYGSPGYTLLARSVQEGDLKKMALLLDHGAEINPGDTKDTPVLHMAVDRGDIDMVALLVTHGADMRAQNRSGETPLHVAVNDNDLSMVTYLLQHGADATIEDEQGDTPRDVAKLMRYNEILRALDAG